MDGTQVFETPPLLIAVPKQPMEEVFPAPLEGASKTLQLVSDGDGNNGQQHPHERSSMPVPAPFPPPQTITNGASTRGSCLDGAGSRHDAVSTDSGDRKSSGRPSSLIGIGPDSPTFVSSPTGILTISTGLSPTKGPCKDSLASATSGSPGPVGYYPTSSYGQPSQIMAPMHAGAGSGVFSPPAVFEPHNNIFGPSPPERPLYMTTRPAEVESTVVEHRSQPDGSAPSTAAGLQQGEIRIKEEIRIKDSLQGKGHSTSLASLDSSSLFAMAPSTPLSSGSSSDFADLNQSELTNKMLRRSLTSATAAGGAKKLKVPLVAHQQRQATDNTDGYGAPGGFDKTCNGRLVDGRGCSRFPAVVGYLGGGLAGGGTHGIIDGSSIQSDGGSLVVDAVDGAGRGCRESGNGSSEGEGEGHEDSIGSMAARVAPGKQPPRRLPSTVVLRTACNECAMKKTKCDGTKPCLSCRRKGVSCEFSLSQKKSKLPKPTKLPVPSTRNKAGRNMTACREGGIISTPPSTVIGSLAGDGGTEGPSGRPRPPPGLSRPLAAYDGAPPNGGRGVRGSRGGRGWRGGRGGRGGKREYAVAGVGDGGDGGDGAGPRGAVGIGGPTPLSSPGGAASSRGGTSPPRGYDSAWSSRSTPSSVFAPSHGVELASSSLAGVAPTTSSPTSSAPLSPRSGESAPQSSRGAFSLRGALRASSPAVRGASRGISRGTAGGGLRGRGRGRGRRGKDGGRAGARAVVSPLDSGSGLGFVEAESSRAGGKHLDRDDYETDGGSSGQKGVSENCITTFAGGQQGPEQRDPTSPQLHEGTPQAQPGQRQAVPAASGLPDEQGEEEENPCDGRNEILFPTMYRHQEQPTPHHRDQQKHRINANQSKATHVGKVEEKKREEDRTEDETAKGAPTESDLLQHKIRDGTLFGIGHFGGIGGLDGYSLEASPAAATSATAGEEESNDRRHGTGYSGSYQSYREQGEDDDGDDARDRNGRVGGDEDGVKHSLGAGGSSGGSSRSSGGGSSGSSSETSSDGDISGGEGDGREDGPRREMARGGGDRGDNMEAEGWGSQDEEKGNDWEDGNEDDEEMREIYDDEDEFATQGEVSDLAEGRINKSTAVGSSISKSRPRRPSRKKARKPVWSQLRKACDRCTSKKVRCDGKEGCFQCSRVGATCHFSICRRSGPRDSNGHKTGTIGPIIPRDGYEKVTGRRGSCRISSQCRFVSGDGQSKTEHYHCRAPGCEYASKTMEELMAHRKNHPEQTPASLHRPVVAKAIKQQAQKLKRMLPHQQADSQGTSQPQQRQKKQRTAPPPPAPIPQAMPPAASRPRPPSRQGSAPPPALLVVQRYSDFGNG
ncbi:unnamed protein product [Ectocarpus sp. 4 AP-2014]